MEQVLEYAHIIAGALIVVIGIVFRYKTKLQAIYNHAKSAFFFVEEIAIQEGIFEEEKVELFKKKFKEFMATGLYWVNESTLQTALDLAKAFCARYRPIEKSESKRLSSVSAHNPVSVVELERVIEASSTDKNPTVVLMPYEQ